jgi:small subunit ribosomal protein S4
MSRYTGPRLRIIRRLDTDLPGLTRKSREKRPYPPGQHGQGRKKRPSAFGMQLAEKQKLCFNYGVSETQMRRLFAEARAKKGVTGSHLLELLERRLDNVVFRAGLAPTIPAARQLVNHGHVRVNARRVDIPSFRVPNGAEITLRPRSQELDVVVRSIAAPSLPIPAWLTVDAGRKAVKLTDAPRPETVPFDVDVQLVVEYYARFA